MIDYIPNDNSITNKTINDKCSRCGECCGLFIPFNDNDINNIKKYVTEHKIKPQNRINIMTGAFEARCCFYDKVNKCCTIYPVRPFACKDFMCNNSDWKVRRNLYEDNAKYNSTRHEMIMASFDDVIYKDYAPMIITILSMCKEANGLIDSNKLTFILRQVGRLDLLKYMTAYDTDNNKIDGTDLVKE